ncbi:copper transporter [Pseudonocardia cypriaca]|uniref:Copper transport outer membrane protein MctB n=1 Tax=Pseudonocardia cypriaca TaxID=882449 RepID=A0A543FTJ5_9PSEU|nr:copper transporter [Pseudonocardia cypriaca]TQM37146.1 copper transport outer membrane protein MctB [Pseudonocardia cypriaca]
MISFRYHLVSIAAVFLALAVGIVLGSAGVSDRLLSAVSHQADDLAGQVQTLRAERDGLAAGQRASDEFARRVGPAAVRGLLRGSTVTLVTSGADPADRDAVLALLQQAGAAVGGEVALTPAVGDPARGDQLRALTAELLPTGAQLPAATDTGSLVGGLLGGIVLAPAGQQGVQPIAAQQADAVLAGLAAAGFVAPGQRPQPGNVVLVLTGGALQGVDAADAAAVTARLAAQLDLAGGGAVLAGRTGSADATGAVGVARAEPGIVERISTVDDVQTGAGQVSAVLALREQLDGRAGSYGTSATATGGAAPAA